MRQFRADRITQRWLAVLQEEIQSWISDLMKDVLDPAKIMSFIQSMGMSVSQLSGAAGQQLGFDPYSILGLSEDCSNEELRSRYLQIMGRIHPDRAGQEMTFLATLVNVAYETICKQRGIA